MSKFNEWNKPQPPLEPSKELFNFVQISSKDVHESRLSLEEFNALIPNDATHIEFTAIGDHEYGLSVNLDFVKKVSWPNPHYDTLIEKYEKDFAKYKIKLADWEKQKKEYDDKKKQKELANDLALYNKLKKKLGK